MEERARSRSRSRARDEAQRKGATEEVAAVAAVAAVEAKPQPREQSNFTDPDRRMMKSPQGWVQGYNAQIMVPDNGGGEQWGNRGPGGEQPGGRHPPPGADAGDSGAEPSTTVALLTSVVKAVVGSDIAGLGPDGIVSTETRTI